MYKSVKYLLLILFVCIIFINVDRINAEEISTADGFSRCVYTGRVQDGQGNFVATSVSVVIRVYKDSDGVIRSYANMRCSETYTEMNAGGADMDACPINNYNDIFHHADEILYPTFGDGGWKCPGEVYVNIVPQNPYAGGNISLTKQAGYQSLSLSDEYSKTENSATSFESDDDSGDFVRVPSVSEAVEDAYEEAGINSVDVDTAAIKRWAEENGLSGDVSIGDPCQAISGNVSNMLVIAFWIISVASIVLLVVMTAISFVKAIVGSDEEKLKAAFQHLLTRIIVVIILLLLPTILTFVIDVINENAAGEISVGTDGNIFCDIDK